MKVGKRQKCQKQQDIDKVAVWFTSTRLTVNASKCGVMNFGQRGQQCITLMNQKVPHKTSCKRLGLDINGKMTFRDHIDYEVKKLNRFSGQFYNVMQLYPSKCLLLFYISYTESVIRYGLLVYGIAAKTNLKSSKTTAINLASIFFKGKLIVSKKETMKRHKLLTVLELHVLEVLNEVVQNLKQESPLDLLMKVDSPCIYATRKTQKGLLPIEFSRTKKSQCLLTIPSEKLTTYWKISILYARTWMLYEYNK